jgi:hypothetical protein
MGRHCNSPSARVTRSVGASYQTPRLGEWISPLAPRFRQFLADAVNLPVGPGEAECGASAEGWRERPALSLFLIFERERGRRADVIPGTAGLPQPPAPSVGPC